MDLTLLEKLTLEHLKHPEVGDRFQEHYSFWCTILFVGKNMLGEPVVIAVDDGEVPYIYTPERFEKRFLYGTIPGSWVYYVDTKIENVRRYDVPDDVNFLWFCEVMGAVPYISPKEMEDLEKQKSQSQYSDYVEHFVGKLANGKYDSKTMNALANALQDIFKQRGVSLEDIQKLSGIL